MQASKRLGAYLLLASSLLSSGLAYATEVTRGPYLQMASDSAMTLRWRTDSNTDSVVHYGSSPTDLGHTVSVSGNTTEHEVRLGGLAPLTQYYYSIGSSGETLAGGDNSYRFTTSPTPGSVVPTRVWLIGDAGTANSNQAAVYNAYLNYPGADNTNLWIMLGDNAYSDGTDSQYQAAVFDMYPELLRRSPLWSTLGNHDGHSADSATESGPYYDIFTLPKNAEAGGVASGTEAYYSFDYGDIHFICLDSYDSDKSPNGAMLTWLQNDVAATDKQWVIAFWHHPPYSKGSHDSDTSSDMVSVRENFLPILEDYGVDLVFSGHSHAYERSYLIDSHYGLSSTFSSAHKVDGGDGREDGDGAYDKSGATSHGGAVYTVAGSSGKTSGGSLNHPAMFASLNQLGSVVLDVDGNRLDATFLRDDGSVGDYYTLIKGPDTTAPTLSGASAVTPTQVQVDFSEAVDATSAGTAANYSVDGGISVTAASASGSAVTLTTSSLTEGVDYTLTVNNVKDTDGNAIAANSQVGFRYDNIQTASFQEGVDGYAGSEDSWIGSGVPDSNFGSDTALLADGDDGGNGETASLVKWDLSGIPSGATVTGAQVVVEVYGASAGSYVLYSGGVDWSEGSATWNSVAPYSNRGAQVGSFVPSSSGSYAIDLNAAGIAAVQSWVDGQPNRGLFIMTGGTSDGLDMRSSEYASSGQRPKLVVTYSVGSGGNQLPTADFDYSASALAVDFTDGSSDSDGSIATWHWDFGDGASATQQNPSHSYSDAGNYTVTLTVTDSDGGSDSTSRAIAVNDGNQPTTVTLQQGQDGYGGAEDTYVASGNSGANFGSSTALLADGNDGANDELVALLQWDLAQIPAGSTVTAASVTLQVYNRSNSSYSLSAMGTAWSEGSATWSNTRPDLNLGSGIGSFSPTSTGSFVIDLDANGIALVQSWVNGADNNGIAIASDGTNNGVDIRSSEYGTQGQRPLLSVTYQ